MEITQKPWPWFQDESYLSGPTAICPDWERTHKALRRMRNGIEKKKCLA